MNSAYGVHDHFDEDSGGDADEKVGGEGHDHGCEKDDQLALPNFPHVEKLFGGGEIVAGENEHGGEGGERDLIEESGDRGNESQKEQTVPKVCPTCFGTIVFVRRGTYDFGNHGQAADG